MSTPFASLPILTPERCHGLIQDVVLRPLQRNEDPRGVLVETLRADWADVYDPVERPFAQCYYSITKPGVARDEDRWHVHQHQDDRFLAINGQLMVAIYDPRPGSPTRGQLNLFHIGPDAPGDSDFLVLIPRQTLHGFLVTGAQPGTLLNYPTRLYDPADEGRIPFTEAGATFPDGSPFSWQSVRDVLGLHVGAGD